MKKFIFITTLLFISSSIYACSCGKLRKLKKSYLNDSTTVFIGTVKRIEEVNTGRYKSLKVLLTVQEGLWNNDSKEIYIYTAEGGGMCGLNFIEGASWYVFAHADESRYWATLCGRSLNLSNQRIQINDDPEERKWTQRRIAMVKGEARRFYKEYKKLDRWFWKLD